MTQQSVSPQLQQVQIAFRGDTTGTRVAATTGAHTSDRLNKMASAIFTVEL